MNTKNKSIIIDGELHKKFKTFCRGKSIKIGGIVEDLIKVFLIKYKEIQKLIDEVKNDN